MLHSSFHSPSLSISVTHYLSLFLSLSHTQSLSLSLSLSPSHSLSLTHCLSHSLSFSHTHTLSLSLSPTRASFELLLLPFYLRPFLFSFFFFCVTNQKKLVVPRITATLLPHLHTHTYSFSFLSFFFEANLSLIFQLKTCLITI